MAARLRAASGVAAPFFLPARQTCDLFALSVPITPTARDVDSPVKVPPLFSRVKWPFTFFFFFLIGTEKRRRTEANPGDGPCAQSRGRGPCSSARAVREPRPHQLRGRGDGRRSGLRTITAPPRRGSLALRRDDSCEVRCTGPGRRRVPSSGKN